MSEIFAIIALIIFIYLASRRIIWGVGLTIILLPSYLWRLDFFGWPSTLLELMIVALFIIWLGKNYKLINWKLSADKANIVPVTLRYLLIGWLIVSLIALAVNPTMAALGLWRAYFLEPLFFLLVFIYSVRSTQDWKIINCSLAILVGGLFVLGIYQYFSGWNLPVAYDYPNIKRLTGPFSYPNALGLLLAPISLWFAGLWLTAKNKIANLWQLLFFLAGFIVIILAKSEGALAATIISLFAYLLFGRLYQKSKTATWLFIIFVVIILPFTGYFKNFSQQLFNPSLTPPATSLEIRSLQWQETWQLLQDHWLAGSGLAGYREAMSNYHQVNWLEIFLYPHNIFLNFWVELGLLGLLAMVGLLIYLASMLIKLFTTKNQLAWPLTLMWSGWLIHGLVDVPYFKNDLSVLFFVMLGMTVLAVNYDQSKPQTLLKPNKQSPRHETKPEK